MKAIDDILDAAGNSTAQVCEDVLLIPIIWIPNVEPTRDPRHHVSITLTNDQVAMHVGLLASWETYSYVTRVMLNMNFTDPVDNQDVTDGIGEMVNMIAGQLKTKLNDK